MKQVDVTCRLYSLDKKNGGPLYCMWWLQIVTSVGTLALGVYLSLALSSCGSFQLLQIHLTGLGTPAWSLSNTAKSLKMVLWYEIQTKNVMLLTQLLHQAKTKVALNLIFLHDHTKNIFIFITCQQVDVCLVLLFFDLSAPWIFFFHFVTVHSHLDLHYAFLPKFTRHIDNRTCTDFPFPPPLLSLPFFEVLKVSSPLFSPCLFFLLPSDLSLPLFISLVVNEVRGHPSSLTPLLLNWLLVASVDSCRHLSPLLQRASEQTSCSFVAFLSLQPQACLPTESKRETLIINSAKVIAVITPICQLQHTKTHTQTQFYSIHYEGTQILK